MGGVRSSVVILTKGCYGHTCICMYYLKFSVKTEQSRTISVAHDSGLMEKREECEYNVSKSHGLCKVKLCWLD